MPLVDLALMPSAEENFKAAVSYGLPKTYPLAINGLFGLGNGVNVVPTLRRKPVNQSFYQRVRPGMMTPAIKPIKDLLWKIKSPELPLPPPAPVYDSNPGVFGLGDLGCGGNCGCKKCGEKSDDIFAPVGNPGPTVSGLGAVPTCDQVCADSSPSDTNWYSCNCDGWQTNPAFAKQPAASNDQFINRTNAVTGAISQLLTPIFAAKASNPPRPTVKVQQTPDYTTIAVIGGSVVLFSVLMLAISRKKG